MKKCYFYAFPQHKLQPGHLDISFGWLFYNYLTSVDFFFYSAASCNPSYQLCGSEVELTLPVLSVQLWAADSLRCNRACRMEQQCSRRRRKGEAQLVCLEGSYQYSIISSLSRPSAEMYFAIFIVPASHSRQMLSEGTDFLSHIAVPKNLFCQNRGSHCCSSVSYRATDELRCWPLRLLFKFQRSCCHYNPWKH